MEPTLSLRYADLRYEVGSFAGWGRDLARWNTEQVAALESAVRSGYRSFLYPILPGTTTTYEWSFLKPTSGFTLLSGAQTVRLADDFGFPDGDLTVAPAGGANRVPWRVPLVHEARLREEYAAWPDRTGRPLMAAVVPLKGTSGTSGQRWQLNVFPVADQDYPLQLAYAVNPDALSDAFPYHMGGMPHSETVLAACCAAFERDKDDMKDGPQAARYRERLAASMAHDRRLKPPGLGYNRDMSDCPGWGRGGGDFNPHYLGYGGVMVNGQTY